jgi:hypothetical protein
MPLLNCWSRTWTMRILRLASFLNTSTLLPSPRLIGTRSFEQIATQLYTSTSHRLRRRSPATLNFFKTVCIWTRKSNVCSVATQSNTTFVSSDLKAVSTLFSTGFIAPDFACEEEHRSLHPARTGPTKRSTPLGRAQLLSRPKAQTKA